ncbi:SRPBCC family protein [Gordonia sputi]|uniref:Polyketide cyclase/dehydrase n=1 Tax=Gordonia sputi NBRC 100414 TaxID=1089453 RepID=H5TVQ1_9ACTN|nr:SRPBCC family protein [Gordonia sputi]NKY96020.1 hypothetical protein [Gordonia sputi]GAB37559.1 hypothetical protein GOSPT_015_00120 [Gordonia sputi NBRC 100414]
MWSATHEGRTTASPDQVYALLSDVSTWPAWNEGVASIEIDGPFEAGTTARMNFPDGSQLPFSITWAKPCLGYEDLTEVPDAGVSVRVRHEVRAEGDGTHITYRCVVDGASDAMCEEVGRQVSSDFDEVIAALGAAAAR